MTLNPFEWSPFYRDGSLSLIQPFTYSSNVTYLKKLQTMAKYLDQMREYMNNIVLDSTKELDAFVKVYNSDTLALVTRLNSIANEVNNAIEAEVKRSNKAIQSNNDAIDTLISGKDAEFDALITRADSLATAANANLTRATEMYANALKAYEIATKDHDSVIAFEQQIIEINRTLTNLINSNKSATDKDVKSLADTLKTHRHDNATPTVDGFLSANDKKSLDHYNVSASKAFTPRVGWSVNQTGMPQFTITRRNGLVTCTGGFNSDNDDPAFNPWILNSGDIPENMRPMEIVVLLWRSYGNRTLLTHLHPNGSIHVEGGYSDNSGCKAPFYAISTSWHAPRP